MSAVIRKGRRQEYSKNRSLPLVYFCPHWSIPLLPLLWNPVRGLSLSTVHCYTLRTSTLAEHPLPLSAFVHIGPHLLPPSCGRPLWMTP